MRTSAYCLCSLLLVGCAGDQPVGTVLEYQLETEALSVQSVDHAAIAAVVERRLNAAGRLGRTSLTDDNLIEVGVFGSDPERTERARQRLQSLGTLEMRIVANPDDDAALIQSALDLPNTEQRVESSDGTLLARWVPVHPKAIEILHSDRAQWGLRELSPQDVEVLVKIDPFHVTGEYLTEAVAGQHYGRRVIAFALNTKGGTLFGALTGANLPSPSGRTRQLGIILNGELHAAPVIRSVVTERGEISGNYSVSEVQALVSALENGALPAPLRLVRERAPGNP